MAPKTRRGGFSIRYFVPNYMHNSKTTGGITTFYLSNDCSTIGDIYFLFFIQRTTFFAERGEYTPEHEQQKEKS